MKKFYNLGAWFVSDLVGSPEDRVSLDKAHLR